MRRFARLAGAAALLTGSMISSSAFANPNLVADFFMTILGAPRVQPVSMQQASLQPSGPAESASVQQTSAGIPREIVSFNRPYSPGTIVVDTSERRLYLVLNGNRALRYAIGVGREGFQWTGSEVISRKQEWPDWRPPAEMLQRRPDLPRMMTGGPDNPLGARALYLGRSLYRIHGSNEPETIGHAVSSGCIRMLNEDVVDLYERVEVGTKVVVTR